MFGYLKVDACIRFARGAELKMAQVVSSAAVTPNPAACVTWQAWHAWTRVKPVCAMKLEVMKVWQQGPLRKAPAQAFWRPWYRHGCLTCCRSFFLEDHPIHHPAIGRIWSDSAQSAAVVWRHVYWWWGVAWGVWQWANAVGPGPRCIMYKDLLHPWYIVAVGAVYPVYVWR